MTDFRPTVAADRPDPHTAGPVPAYDRILVAGGAPATLDMLRLAVLRSDDVVLVMPGLDDALARFTRQFAVDVRERPMSDADVQDATSILVAMGDLGAENRIVRAARRVGVPVHVAERSLVSDFTALAFLERDPSSFGVRHRVARPGIA